MGNGKEAAVKGKLREIMGGKIKLDRVLRDLPAWSEPDIDRLRSELNRRVASKVEETPSRLVVRTSSELDTSHRLAFRRGVDLLTAHMEINRASRDLGKELADIAQICLISQLLPTTSQQIVLKGFFAARDGKLQADEGLHRLLYLLVRTLHEYARFLPSEAINRDKLMERGQVVNAFCQGIACLMSKDHPDGGKALFDAIAHYGNEFNESIVKDIKEHLPKPGRPSLKQDKAIRQYTLKAIEQMEGETQSEKIQAYGEYLDGKPDRDEMEQAVWEKYHASADPVELILKWKDRYKAKY